jgi:hypothetical protein
MPTSIHNCIQGWVTSEVGMWCGRGILNEDEVSHLEVEAGTSAFHATFLILEKCEFT